MDLDISGPILYGGVLVDARFSRVKVPNKKILTK